MVEVPLPDHFIAAQVSDHFSEGDHGEDDHRGEVEADVRKGLTTQLVLDEIVKREQLTPTPDELTQFVTQRAVRAGVDPNEYARKVVEAGNFPLLVAELARAKALARVVERARVLDTKGEVVHLDRLRDDGSLADEAAEGVDEKRDEPAAPVQTQPEVETIQIPLGQQQAQ
jgi:trigger factor